MTGRTSVSLTARRYYATAVMAASNQLSDNWMFLFDFAIRGLRVVMLLALWRIVLAGREGESPLPLAAVLTYTLIAEVFLEQFQVRTTIQDAFWEGTIVTRFLQPIGVVGQFTAEMAGRWALHFVLFSLPLLAVAPLLGVDPRPAGPSAAALFVVSLVLAISVGLALDFLFAAMTVALEQPVWLIEYVRTAIAMILSGQLLPLALLPWGLGEVFAWLPFASMAWVPLAIYTGFEEPFSLMVRQLGWSLLLWPLSMWMWRSNRQKLVGYGG